MEMSKKKERMFNIALLLLTIILIFTIIYERRYRNNLADIYKFFTNTGSIESIVVYDNVNKEEIRYNNKDDIQEIINKHKFNNSLYSARKVQKGELLYSVKVYLAEDWVEVMQIYHVDNAETINSDKVTFKINKRNCILLFRDKICSIVVSND